MKCLHIFKKNFLLQNFEEILDAKKKKMSLARS